MSKTGILGGLSRTHIVLWLALGAAPGCATTASGPAFARAPLPPGKGVIYIYRPSAMSGGARTIFISVPFEANNCYALEGDGFFTHVTDPGRINVAASGSGDAAKLPVSVAPGQEKYVRVEWGTWGSAEMTEVSAQEGSAQISGMRGIAACSN